MGVIQQGALAGGGHLDGVEIEDGAEAAVEAAEEEEAAFVELEAAHAEGEHGERRRGSPW
jgi:hypothetical protein